MLLENPRIMECRLTLNPILASELQMILHRQNSFIPKADSGTRSG